MVALSRTPTPVILDARVLAGSGGGPDKTIINSPRYLDADGYRMLCVYLHDPADPGFPLLAKKAAARDVQLLSVADHGPLDWRVVPRMVELCRRERVDVWHGHDYKTNAVGLLVNRFHPMRLVTTLHGWVQRTSRTPLYYLVDRLSLRFYEKVICVSEDLYTAARRAGVAGSRCELIQNGIELDDYRRTMLASEAKSRCGIQPGRKVIGAVGRLSPEKGFSLLIDAVDQLIAAGQDLELLIVGEGSQQKELEAQIVQRQRQDRIKLLGYRGDLPRWYEAMDLFVLSSEREGLPNVLLEAMAMEVPVVATAVNGVPKLIRDGEDGVLIPSKSVDAIREAVQQLLHNPTECARLAKAGRNKVETRYSFQMRMHRLRQVYDQLLAARLA